MLTLNGYLKCANLEQVELIKQHLPEHERLSRAEKGCISFDVIATDDPLIWKVAEAFKDRDSFDKHQARMQLSVWGSKTAAIERVYELTDEPNA